MEELRSQFPVCQAKAYFNAGTCGPLPRAATEAMTRIAEHALAEGRALGYYEELLEQREQLRAAYAGLLGAPAREVSIETSTSEGIVRVLLGLDLPRGAEVLVAEGEHPGLLGPLAAISRRDGLTVREVPLRDIADAVTGDTRLVACSQVGWTTGEVMPSLAHLGGEVPVLIDGAQGVGAVPVDLRALGATFYAGSGQKWLCGPVGTGMLWVAPEWRDRILPSGPGYMNLEEPAAGLRAQPAADGRAYDTLAPSLEILQAALAAIEVLAAHGWERVHARAREQAAQLAGELEAAGREVLPRGDSTLVSWRSPDAAAEAARLRDAGVICRDFPGLPFVRASVGAWNDQADVGRLLDVATAS
jgi:L-cysteine/cystine lyase